jgi:hypothetical protein
MDSEFDPNLPDLPTTDDEASQVPALNPEEDTPAIAATPILDATEPVAAANAPVNSEAHDTETTPVAEAAPTPEAVDSGASVDATPTDEPADAGDTDIVMDETPPSEANAVITSLTPTYAASDYLPSGSEPSLAAIDGTGASASVELGVMAASGVDTSSVETEPEMEEAVPTAEAETVADDAGGIEVIGEAETNVATDAAPEAPTDEAPVEIAAWASGESATPDADALSGASISADESQIAEAPVASEGEAARSEPAPDADPVLEDLPARDAAGAGETASDPIASFTVDASADEPVAGANQAVALAENDSAMAEEALAPDTDAIQAGMAAEAVGGAPEPEVEAEPVETTTIETAPEQEVEAAAVETATDVAETIETTPEPIVADEPPDTVEGTASEGEPLVEAPANPDIAAPPPLPPAPADEPQAHPQQRTFAVWAPVAPPKDKTTPMALEIILGLFGIHGIGWLVAGYTSEGLFWLVGSIVYLVMATVVSAVTLGFGLICLVPIAIGLLVWSALALNSRLKTSL